MGPSGRIGHILYILDCLGQVYVGLYLGRAPRTKETLPDFLKWHRVTRRPLVFRGLTGSQRTPGFWGVTLKVMGSNLPFIIYLLLLLLLLFYLFLTNSNPNSTMMHKRIKNNNKINITYA